VVISQTGNHWGASGIYNLWKTYLGMKKDGFWILYPDEQHSFQGRLECIIPLGKNEYLFTTYFDSGSGNGIFRSDYFNVYYLNTAHQTIRMVGKELGKTLAGIYLQSVNYGELFNHKVEMKYQEGNKHFTLIEHRSLKTDDNTGSELKDIVEAKYEWDARNFGLKKIAIESKELTD
jgi:hypothetical protein